MNHIDWIYLFYSIAFGQDGHKFKWNSAKLIGHWWAIDSQNYGWHVDICTAWDIPYVCCVHECVYGCVCVCLCMCIEQFTESTWKSYSNSRKKRKCIYFSLTAFCLHLFLVDIFAVKIVQANMKCTILMIGGLSMNDYNYWILENESKSHFYLSASMINHLHAHYTK